jgi:hypothetical protein
VHIPSEGAKELRQVSLLAKVQPGVRLYDRRTGGERLVHAVEARGQVVFLSFRNPRTGAIDRQPFSLAELGDRFEILSWVSPSA